MNWWRPIGILALYGALTLFMTMPVPLQLTTHVAGRGGDAWQSMWRFEDRWRALSENSAGATDFFSQEIFGRGEARLINISVWPWMWLHVALGEPAAYNIVYLLSYVLSGFFMYGLVRYLTHHDAAASLAGMLYMFLPFHVAQSMGHFGAMQMQWIPLAAWFLFVWLKRPTLWSTLGLAATIMIQSWTEHHTLLWMGIFMVIFAVFWMWPRRREWRVYAPWATLLAALIFFFAILPWVPVIRLALQSDAGQGLVLGQDDTIRFSADVFSYVTPPAWHPIWGKLAYDFYGRHFTGNMVEAVQFLGWVPLLLIAFFHRNIPRRQKLFWLLVLAVFWLISLGPRLHVFGRVLTVPLPFALVDEWPVFNFMRVVGRAGAGVGLAVAVLFGWVLAREMKRPITILIVGALLLGEFLFLPVSMARVEVSRVHEVLAELPGTRVVEIPAATNYIFASQALYASLVHGKETVGSIALERASGGAEVAEARSLPGLRQLLFLRSDQLQAARPDFFGQDLAETLPDVMRYLDASAVVVWMDSLSAHQRGAVQSFLQTTLRWHPESFGEAVLYRAEFSRGDGVFLTRGREWVDIEIDAARGVVLAEVPRVARVRLYNVGSQAREVRLEFLVDRGSVRVADTVIHAGERGQVRVVLPPGSRELEFESLLPEAARIREPVMYVQ